MQKDRKQKDRKAALEVLAQLHEEEKLNEAREIVATAEKAKLLIQQAEAQARIATGRRRAQQHRRQERRLSLARLEGKELRTRRRRGRQKQPHIAEVGALGDGPSIGAARSCDGPSAALSIGLSGPGTGLLGEGVDSPETLQGKRYH